MGDTGLLRWVGGGVPVEGLSRVMRRMVSLGGRRAQVWSRCVRGGAVSSGSGSRGCHLLKFVNKFKPLTIYVRNVECVWVVSVCDVWLTRRRYFLGGGDLVIVVVLGMGNVR